MGQVYLQSFLVLSGCPFRCPAVPHKQLWEHWKLTDRLCNHWGPVLAHLGAASASQLLSEHQGGFLFKMRKVRKTGLNTNFEILSRTDVF